MTGHGHATAAPRRVRKSRRLMTNLRVDPLHFSPEPRWRALAPTGASQVPAATASGSLARVGGGPCASRPQDRRAPQSCLLKFPPHHPRLPANYLGTTLPLLSISLPRRR